MLLIKVHSRWLDLRRKQQHFNYVNAFIYMLGYYGTQIRISLQIYTLSLVNDIKNIVKKAIKKKKAVIVSMLFSLIMF